MIYNPVQLAYNIYLNDPNMLQFLFSALHYTDFYEFNKHSIY